LQVLAAVGVFQANRVNLQEKYDYPSYRISKLALTAPTIAPSRWHTALLESGKLALA
jgi:hypothetical protein